MNGSRNFAAHVRVSGGASKPALDDRCIGGETRLESLDYASAADWYGIDRVSYAGAP